MADEQLIFKTGIDFGSSLADFKKLQSEFIKTRATIDQLSRSAATLKKELRDGLKAGTIKEGTKAYDSLIAKIADTELALKAARKGQRDLNKEFERLSTPEKSIARLRKETNKLAADLDRHVKGVTIATDEYDELKKTVADNRLQIIKYDKSLNDGRTNVGRYAESLNGLIVNLKRVASEFAITFSVGAIKSFVDETTQAFEVQAQNESKLLAAIRLRVQSQEEADAIQRRLLESASSLQEATNGLFTDEQIIQQQSFLASLGKTEQEINKIIAASVDLSTGANIGLDSSVRNLAKTYSGLAGELGEAIPQLRNLTKEELEAGAAVELVTKQFAGQAVAAGEAGLGAIRGYREGIGDLKEEIGEQLLPIQERLTRAQFEFFTLIRDGLGVITRNIDVILTLATTIGALIVQQKIANAVTKEGSIAARIYSTVTGVLSGRINLLTTAQQFFNKTFSNLGKLIRANPIGFLITVLGLATAGFQILKKNIDTVIVRFDKWSKGIIEATENIPIIGTYIKLVVAELKLFFKAIQNPSAAFAALKETALAALDNIKASLQVILNSLSIGFKRIKQLGADATFNAELSEQLQKEIDDLKGKNEGLRNGAKNLGATFTEAFNREVKKTNIEIPQGDMAAAESKGGQLGGAFGKGVKEAAEGSIKDLGDDISKLNTQISKTTNENVIEKKLREIAEKKKDVNELNKVIDELRNKVNLEFRLSDEEFNEILEKGTIPILNTQITELRKALETSPDSSVFAEELQRLIALEEVLAAKEDERLAKAKEVLSSGDAIQPLQSIDPLAPTDTFDPSGAEASLGEEGIEEIGGLESLTDPRIAQEEAIQERLTEITEAAAKSRTDAEIAERLRLEEQTAKFEEQRVKLLSGGINQMSVLTGQFLVSQEKDYKLFGKQLLKTALDIVEKQVLLSVAQASAASLASPESVSSFGIAGLAKAALLTALIKGAFAGIKAAVSSFEEGGVIGERTSMLSTVSKKTIKPGFMGGDAHSDPSGGTLIQHGKDMAMVEKNEFIDYDEFDNVNVVNRKSARIFAPQLRKIAGKKFEGKQAYLSMINSFQGHGVAFNTKTPKYAKMNIKPFVPPLPMMVTGGVLESTSTATSQADISRLEDLLERQVLATERINVFDQLQEATRRQNIDDTLSRP